MPRAADPAVRDRLLATAADILATEGPRSLTTRRLATEAGTSTMAVYTYFGSMDDLRRELRSDGFAHLCDALDALPSTEDPLVDLAAAVGTYVALGTTNPAWYRALFVDLPPDDDDQAGIGVYERLVALVDRCIRAGRFTDSEPAAAVWAAEVWLAGHGVVNLGQSRLLPVDSLRHLLSDMLYRLAVGFGDRPDRARASVEESLDTTASGSLVERPWARRAPPS